MVVGFKFDLTHSGHKPSRHFLHMTATLWHSGALGGVFGVTLAHFGVTLGHFGVTLGLLLGDFGNLWGDFGDTLGRFRAYEGDTGPH